MSISLLHHLQLRELGYRPTVPVETVLERRLVQHIAENRFSSSVIPIEYDDEALVFRRKNFVAVWNGPICSLYDIFMGVKLWEINESEEHLALYQTRKIRVNSNGFVLKRYESRGFGFRLEGYLDGERTFVKNFQGDANYVSLSDKYIFTEIATRERDVYVSGHFDLNGNQINGYTVPPRCQNNPNLRQSNDLFFAGCARISEGRYEIKKINLATLQGQRRTIAPEGTVLSMALKDNLLYLSVEKENLCSEFVIYDLLNNDPPRIIQTDFLRISDFFVFKDDIWVFMDSQRATLCSLNLTTSEIKYFFSTVSDYKFFVTPPYLNVCYSNRRTLINLVTKEILYTEKYEGSFQKFSFDSGICFRVNQIGTHAVQLEIDNFHSEDSADF